jgi:hypothetical protein
MAVAKTKQVEIPPGLSAKPSLVESDLDVLH